MDQSSTPWRAFEAPDEATESPRPSGKSAGAAGPNGAPMGVIVAIAAATVLLVIGAVIFAGGGAANASVVVAPSDGVPTGTAAPGVLVIDVAGAVVDPGLYRLPTDARVADAIAIAGGYGPRVDARRVAQELNLAALLTDGQHLLVPSRDDVLPVDGGSGSSGASSDAGGGQSTGGLIDLNRATVAELDALPGIGPVTAAKIISSRETERFVKVDDLRDRKLVGQKTFDGLRDLVTVR
ncbi:MAG: ComEA family DNA-binding protein [Chloroflexota bacterium]